jgi:carboxymethylenebutenolidase
MPDLTDPTRATNPALKRGAFVGLSAGIATMAAPASLSAQPLQLGKPHPPLVAENDPDIVVARPQIGATTSRSIDAYYAAPKNATKTTPGVVVVMQAFGVDAQIRDTVRRLAKAGYRAIAPNLFGPGAPSGDNTEDFEPFRPLLGKLADDVVDQDLTNAVAYLRQSSPSKIGITGFCMGGAITLRQTVDRPGMYQAAAVWYGKVRYGTTDNKGTVTPIALAYADEITAPLLGSWGERDTSILSDDVHALDRRLAELGKPHDLKSYATAVHGFFDDTRGSYDAVAADDGWKRMLAWFDRYLR